MDLVYRPGFVPGAAVGQHLRQVGGQAVVRARLNGQPDTLRAALFAESYCLSHVGGRMSRQRVVQIPHEIVAVISRQGHESAAHENELHLQWKSIASVRVSEHTCIFIQGDRSA